MAARTRCLGVDDHPVVRQGLALLFNGSEDVELVGTVTTGEEALEAIEKLQPQVVVMDVRLPGIDGVLLVVKLGESRRDELRRALKLLGTLRSKVIGVVITNAERPSDKYDYYATEPPVPVPAVDPLGPRRRGRRPAPRFEDQTGDGNGSGAETEPVSEHEDR